MKEQHEHQIHQRSNTMPIGYYVTENKLTSPVSYFCRTQANEILDFDDVAALINARDPVISKAVALIVLNDLRAVVKDQLLAGKTVKLKNFCSFVTGLPATLASPIDPLPPNVLTVTGKVSVTFRDELRTDAEFIREGYTSKEPSIIQVVDAQRNVANTMEELFPIEIHGNNLKFLSTDEQQGIFTDNGVNGERRAVIYPSIGKKTVSFINNVANYIQGTGYRNEYTLTAKTKYTESGSLRVTAYSKPIRQRIPTHATNRNQIYSRLDDTNVWFGTLNSCTVSITDPAYANIVLRRDTQGVITARMQNYPQYGGTIMTGDEITISGNGLVNIPPVGEILKYAITIANFDLIEDLMDKYSGELVEPLTIEDIAAP
jgi:hypothetical protein